MKKRFQAEQGRYAVNLHKIGGNGNLHSRKNVYAVTTDDEPHCVVKPTDQTCWRWPSTATFCWW